MSEFHFTAEATKYHYPWAPPGWHLLVPRIFEELTGEEHACDAGAAGVCVVASWVRFSLRRHEGVEKGINYPELALLAALPLYKNQEFRDACYQASLLTGGPFQDFQVSLADNTWLTCSAEDYGWWPVMGGRPEKTIKGYVMLSIISVPGLLVKLAQAAQEGSRS